MSFTRADLENAIAGALRVEGSPFKQVHTGKSHLSDDELGAFLETLGSGNTSPAAVVLYAGGRPAPGFVGGMEEATIQVLVVGVGRTREEAAADVFAPLDFVLAALHEATIEGLGNLPAWTGTDRFRLPNRPMTVAAWVATFSYLVAFKGSI